MPANGPGSDDTVQEFTVRLDSPEWPGGSAVFQAGQMVTGRVRLRLRRPLTLRNLDLLVQGSGTVGWGQGGGHFVRDDEVYVNDMAELVATGLGEVVTLSAGEHVFPFACSLPRHLPATFTGSFGSVAYSAKAVMQSEVPAAGGPWIAVAPFAVESQLSPASAAEHSEQLRPCVLEARMICGPRGRSVKASLEMPKRVFANQEDVVVSATVANRSRRTISRLTAGLVMDCLYQAGDRQQFKESLLVADRLDEYRIGHMEGRCWKNVRLRIPRLVPPSGLPHCRLISVTYSLLFRAEVENCSKDLNLRVPIVVGAAPPTGATANGVGDESMSAAAAAAEDNEEPEVMMRRSRVSRDDQNGNADGDGDGDSGGGGDSEDAWSQRQQQQPPSGSTEKQARSEYYIFDPATQQRSPIAAGAADEAGGPSAFEDAGAGGTDGRYLPPDFYAPNTDMGENLY